MKSNLKKFVLLALAVYFLVDFATERPETATFGNNINPPSNWKVPNKNSFVVATYNIRRSKGEDGKRAIDRSIKVLENSGADIIGMNELSGTIFYGLTNQAEQVGKSLDAGWLFAPTYRQFFQDYFGNGIVSKFAVDWWAVHPLLSSEIHDSSPRNMIIASIPVGDTRLYLINTHLDRREDRKAQLGQVLKSFSSLPSPAILLGDLNTRADDPLLSQFLKNPDYLNATYAIDNRHDVEWIISKGLSVLSGGSEPVGVSDHPAYWIKFGFK